MSCPKCHTGLLVADPFWMVVAYRRVRCVNCGLHLTEGWPVNLPPFHANGEAVQTNGNGANHLKRTGLTPKQEAYRAYMKAYMRAYRKRRHTIPNMMSHVL